MEYRELGSTGVEISEISLGAEHLEDAEPETVRKVVWRAVDSGINFMDLVLYAAPDTRDKMGAVLEGVREKIMISGHLGATWKDGEYHKTRDPDPCGASFDDLLSRLGTDHVDVLMFHWVDSDEDFDDAFDRRSYLELALKLRREGKARVLALSTHHTSIAIRAIRSGFIDAIMFPINPAHDLLPGDFGLKEMWNRETYQQLSVAQASERRELLLTCEDQGVGLIAMKPFAGGLLLPGGHLKPDRRGKGLEHPCGIALSPVQCLSYALSQPGVSTVLPGCRTPEELESSLAYFEAGAAERDFSAIDAAELWTLKRSCVYCNHCLPCPVGIEIGTLLRLLVAAEYGSVRTVAGQYEALSAKASDCTQCEICEERCPFGVPVLQRMERAVEIFGG